ncbi:hypothetical protein GOODEAATRI_002508 [Goodea atripinnis]|uniref:DUF4704 domain-containing protein n=1 Tax=Goodea atripinnis TaxID=208336 RepID=A0ABV0MEF2_9TELE
MLGVLASYSITVKELKLFFSKLQGENGQWGTFKYKAESDLLFAEHHKTLLYDGKLSSSISFTYNPCATDAQLCLESSPKDNASIFVHSPHALMLQDVKAVVTHSVQSGIHSIGGMQVLFPLFAQLDYCRPSSQEPDTSVCCTLLSFMMELLKNSVAMQEQVLACKGFLVIGYTLEKSSKMHVTRPVLDIVLAFSRYLSNLQNGIYLLKQLCDHIMFNPAIWIHAPAKVQLMLYTYLATEFISTVTIYNAVRRVGTVLQIMHTLKYYYWVVNPHDCKILKVIAALLKNSPQSPETMEVRRVFLSDMIKLFNNNRENRSLLQCSVWQEWMLSLCFVNPQNNEEQKITEMVYAIFRILLYHAVKYEWGGWRVWVDTLSITHSKKTCTHAVNVNLLCNHSTRSRL